MKKKIIIIGGGPGGYTAAIRAAQLGAQVTLAEAGFLGGTCLNVGCIPTKTLLHIADFFRCASDNAVPGVNIRDLSLDWPAALSHKADLIAQLRSGINSLLRHHNVSVINAKATPLAANRVRIADDTLDADAIILASGSLPVSLNIPGSDSFHVIDSSQALSIPSIPHSILIVGGGVIGVEFASLFRALGANVTLIELTPSLLPNMDDDISDYIRLSLEADGITVRTNTKLLRFHHSEQHITADFDSDNTSISSDFDKALIAVGRRPNTDGLGLDDIGVKLHGGAVVTDNYFCSSLPGLYAVGDCNAKSTLAHAAMAQGIFVAEHICGTAPSPLSPIVPACVYSLPELASAGLTEKQAAAQGFNYSVGRFDLSGNAKSLIENAGRGFVKIIADSKYREILGVHIAAPKATELIAEAVLCMNMEGTAEELAAAIHAHPTVSEALAEAALSISGLAIHGL